MRAILGLLLVILLNTSCNSKFLKYPYAENNATTTSYAGIEVSDDYKWLEMNPAQNNMVRAWLDGQCEVACEYFGKSYPNLYTKIDELTSFSHYKFIQSSSDTLYYIGFYPYSNRIDLYRYYNKKNTYLKSLDLPFRMENDMYGLMLAGETHIALVGPGEKKNNHIYIYNMDCPGPEPTTVIKNVMNYPIVYRNSESFFFTRDAIVSDSLVYQHNIRTKYRCDYGFDKGKLVLKESIIYTDPLPDDVHQYDIVYDGEMDQLYIGEYDFADANKYVISKINDKKANAYHIINGHTANEKLRLIGIDSENFYLIGITSTLKATLYAINKKTSDMYTIFSNPTMDIRHFSMSKDHIMLYFQNQNENRAYLINNKSLRVQEFPVNNGSSYKFYSDKKMTQIYFLEETLIKPKEIYESDVYDFTDLKKLSGTNIKPFDSDDYCVEYVKVSSGEGRDINLQLMYKKGMKRDGSNPAVIMAHLNAENSTLDRFYLNRILYMDKGFIYVQRAMSDAKTDINLSERVEDIYASYQYLIKEKYTSAKKIAFIGREFGASALIQMFNKYNINAPAVLYDGIYDYLDYNEQGRLLYMKKKVFAAYDSTEMSDILKISPYQNVRTSKSYPPLLFMATDSRKEVPAGNTYRMAAKIQMRTKMRNPVVMLTPDLTAHNSRYDDFSYKMFLEYSFIFIFNQLGVRVD